MEVEFAQKYCRCADSRSLSIFFIALSIISTVPSTSVLTQGSVTKWKGNSTVWRSSGNWDNGVPTSSLTTRISVTNLDPYVPVPLDGDTARTGSLEIQESGDLYFDSTGILIIHGSELKIQNLGTINLGYGKLIAKNSITFFNGGTFLAETGVLEFSGVTWENRAGSTFNPGTSTVIFNGSGSQTLIINDTSSFSFYNLQISSGGTVTIDGDLIVNGDCILDEGSSISVSSGGSLTINGSFAGDPTSISGDGIISLPVQLSSFTVTANRLDAVLRWSTASEVNNYGFEIERRSVGASGMGKSEWVTIGFVQGAGTTTETREYSFIDTETQYGRYAYRLKQIDLDGTFAYYSAAEIEVGLAPKQLALNDNYPNPFNPSTRIEFTVPENGRASLKVFNVIGQLVATLYDRDTEAGRLVQVTFSAPALPSGIYFYRLEYRQQSVLKRMLLVK